MLPNALPEALSSVVTPSPNAWGKYLANPKIVATLKRCCNSSADESTASTAVFVSGIAPMING
jgi:hypothetical protein